MIRILFYVALAGAAAALFDLLGRRVLARGECGLHKALILPDTCQGRCPPGQRCGVMETRAHWLWGRQAAACGCIAARDDDRWLSPEEGGLLPRPAPQREPDRQPEREEG